MKRRLSDTQKYWITGGVSSLVGGAIGVGGSWLLFGRSSKPEAEKAEEGKKKSKKKGSN